MDSMETRLRSLVEQGFSATVSADKIAYGENVGQIRFTTRLTLYGKGGASVVSVTGDALTFAESAERAVAACEAYVRPLQLVAAE